MTLSHGTSADPAARSDHPSKRRALARRLGVSALALVMADLLVGFIVFSLATLGILWYLGFAWIQLAHEYAADQMSFGSASQLQMATLLIFVVPIMMGLVCYLGIIATRLPRRVWTSATSGAGLRTTLAGPAARRAIGAPPIHPLLRH
ncbi:MAG: hypothetical protein L3K19_02495 [Thermoplasmata archaeon]|nr:hypothetical protein [Thermoplasmata archaeon]